MSHQGRCMGLGFLCLCLAACNPQYPEACPSSTPVGLSNADHIASDESLPFRFPLDESAVAANLYFGWFGVSNECPPGKVDCYEYPERLFHAAEDYERPAGTPVYAMADGIVRFSGTAGGYGWLILIDHPAANLYSLYGHLSPSRWKLAAGREVKRGDLVAYLGDSNENGGSDEQPLDPHLHFGIRAGQVADYPTRGEWRFQGGWIKPCPQDVGWLQPSAIITGQKIPAGGYPQPPVSFLTRWGLEILFGGSISIFGGAILIVAARKKNRYQWIIPGVMVTAAGIVTRRFGLMSNYTLVVIGMVYLVIGAYQVIRLPTGKQTCRS